ncbi:hypothetical protein [Aquabacter cavernae]|uniref:hypothetical protein n=1 Tax=Aquabacter cavernae TaxID=2496029 RepID=UPI000F8D0E06|nr:hypothetical protein [Aquabacter cavernae]
MGKKAPGKKKVGALILDRLAQLDDKLEALAEKIEALEERIDLATLEKTRRDHRDARIEERRIAYERRFDVGED